jgi:hypothetical protein
LTEYIKEDTLLATEKQIFEAVLKWLEEAGKNGSVDDDATLLACVRFYRMSVKQLADIRSAGLVPESMLDEALLKKNEIPDSW